MSLITEFAIPLSGLLCGGIFGYVLESGGLGNCRKLTGQLMLRDFTVFNVMFTAIIVAAGGLYVLELFGLMSAAMVYTPPLYLGAALTGGALVGVGMGVGGYCPGTSVVAACGGRIDGLFFFGGLLLGTLVFSGVYEQLEPLMRALPGPQARTLSDLLGLPPWAILLALVAVAAVVGGATRNIGKARRAQAPATA